MLSILWPILNAVTTLVGVALLIKMIYEPLIGILLLLIVSRENGFSYLRSEVSQLINKFFKRFFQNYWSFFYLLGDDCCNTSKNTIQESTEELDDADYMEWIEKRCEILAVSPKEENTFVPPPPSRRVRVNLPAFGRGRGRGVPLPQHHHLLYFPNIGRGNGNNGQGP